MISLFPERRNLLKRCKIILLFNLPSDLCCWSRGGGKSSSYREVLLKKRVLDTWPPGEFNKAINPQMQDEATLSLDLLLPDFLGASLDFACWCLQKSASWKDLSLFSWNIGFSCCVGVSLELIRTFSLYKRCLMLIKEMWNGEVCIWSLL